MEPIVVTTLIWAVAGAIIFFFGVFIGASFVKSTARSGYLFLDGEFYTVRKEQ